MSGIERVCISVNSVCNLKCTYCYFFIEPGKLPGPKVLSREDLDVILGNVERYGRRPEADKPVKVNFVGSGEPLMEWKSIHAAVAGLRERRPAHAVRFYTVTNGLLLSRKVAQQMREIGLGPSVSLDGPEHIHDATRVRHNGRGSHRAAMKGIEALREEGTTVAVNVTMTRQVVANLEAVFDFIQEQGFEKVIFGRLVDVPEEHEVSTAEFYAALRRVAELKTERGLHQLEVGNLEAYRRALAGAPDRVCTMFGSTCGSGFHNIIYMQRDVYPCGRMVGIDRWKLGRFDEPLERFPERMAEITGGTGCGERFTDADSDPAGVDCLLEREREDYDPAPRRVFVGWMGGARHAGASKMPAKRHG